VRVAEMNGGPESGFAEVDRASLSYEVVGNGEPLVLIHAGIADRRMWDGQLGAFAERPRVIRDDVRGCDHSDTSEGAPFSYHDDLRGSLGIERASFVGFSIGAKTVIDFALNQPWRARALVLVCPSVSGFEAEDDPPDELEELVKADEAGDLERVSELEVRIWVDGPYRGPERVDPAVRDLVREMNLIALQNEAALGEERPADPPAVERLAEIQAAVLVVAGELDRPEVNARRSAGEKHRASAEGRGGRDRPRAQHGETGGVQPGRARVLGRGGDLGRPRRPASSRPGRPARARGQSLCGSGARSTLRRAPWLCSRGP
jgi:3-oxoadipate enol-lactonase